MKTIATIGFVLLCLSGLGCQQDAKPAAHGEEDSHAKAAHPDERTLNAVVLTEKENERLGIKLAEAELREVQMHRTLGGELVVPPGNTIVVSAPIPGTVSVPKGKQLPMPGVRLDAGEEVFVFTPLLTPERDVLPPAERVRVAQTRADVATLQLESSRAVETAKLQVEVAQIAYDRAVDLLKNKAGSQRSVDETQAQLKLARELLETAEIRAKFLAEVSLDEAAGKLAKRSIECPVGGVLHDVGVAPGETVAAGKVLFRIIKMEQLWVRVPVYVGYVRNVDTKQPASIREFGQSPNVPSVDCSLVSAPPSADPLASTVDLFYALDNQQQQLYPGQKLSVTLPMDEQEERLVIPWAAVLYDIHGGAWVYRQTAEFTYARQRIEVAYSDGENAVLSHGLEAGAKVVTDGAAELFGTEFGVGH